MEYGKAIRDMHPGDEVEGFYILRSAALKTTAAGKPFMTAVFSDRGGTIEGKLWDYTGPIGPADAGKVIKLRGTVGEYRGTPQITVGRLRLAAPEDPVETNALVPVAPLDRGQTYDEVLRWVESIDDADYRAVCREMLRRHGDAFERIPAAKSVHHAFLGGLLMHTANMLRTADFLARLYAGTVDRSLLLAGTLLHDFAKAEEFVFSQLGLVTDYSVKGQLLGHLVMGAQEAAEVCAALGVPEEKSVLLQHLILSHHGEPEFGAAVRPQCAESELLSCIDTIDSRMEIYRETYEELEPGTFSPRIFALERRVYKHN